MSHRVAFEPDAGAESGLGHLTRCLALATALREAGVHCTFNIEGNGVLVESLGFETGRGDAASAVVVDSYRATPADLEALATGGKKVIVIDDLADRRLAVDLVINSGIAAEQLRYPEARARALGIEYALLRPEFRREPSRSHAAEAHRLLITVGGSDPHDLTPRLVEALGARFASIDVVIGPFFKNRIAIESAARRFGSVELHANIWDLHSLMMNADLAITGGGQTLGELAATGTPAVAVEIAANQVPNLEGFSARGTLIVAGRAVDPVIMDRVTMEVVALAGDRTRRQTMSENGRALVDGRGAERAARRIIEQVEGARV